MMLFPACKSDARTRQRGLGLIEVLVAVSILSIGFLSIAALQAMSLSTNHSAMARGMATMASYSILDAMRADLDAARQGSYNTSTPLKASACPDAGSSMLSTQRHDWCDLLGKTLGVAETTTGSINCVGTEGDCTVTIQFDDSRAGMDDDEYQALVTRAML